MDLPIGIDRGGARTIPVQLADQLRILAFSGVLRVGDRLPPRRVLAAEHGLSRQTVSSAYDQLHAEGWVVTRRGAGTYVESVPAQVEPALERAGAEVPAPIDLRPGAALPDVLDPAAWRRAMRAAADRTPPARVVDDADSAFAESVCLNLLRHRRFSADSGVLLATSGTAAALAEIAAVLPAKSTVMVERPGWARAAALFRGAGHRVVGAAVDEQGLDPQSLRLPGGAVPKLVVCTPAHQFPLGMQMSARRRAELVGWARAHGAWGVEDDYDGELRHAGPPLPLLASLAPDRVVHLGSVSKTISPALGCGWMIAPDEVRRQVLARRRTDAGRPGVLPQRVVAELAASGDLDRHLRRVRTELRARRDLVVAGFAACEGVRVEGASTGSHIVVATDTAALERALVDGGAEAGITVTALSSFRSGDGSDPARVPARCGLVLGYAGCGRDDLGRAVGVLAGAAARFTRGRPRQVRSDE